ncbi:hypothetical protein I79_018435 [Cricetulus griseus]|uniref:Uncharacterized protein n=1 Tax=Cricetulus griseus TaxID=10029 RepID=G3I4Q2_CRIGR|nr:hypothetical protein I79_018435 [Cricetulus griseus]
MEKPCLEKPIRKKKGKAKEKRMVLDKLKYDTRGRRDGSVVKSTDCSSRGPEFNSQQPHGGSQPSIIRSGALF